jgi:uncharacterized protein
MGFSSLIFKKNMSIIISSKANRCNEGKRMALADIINSRNQENGVIEPVSYEQAKPILKWVYTWMFFGLFITAVVATFTAGNQALLSLVLNPVGMIVLIVAQLGIVFGLSAAMPKLSPGAAAGLFMLYSGLTGLTMSVIFIVFSLGTIASAFLSAAGLFAAMTVVGFTTKVDLSKFSGILMMGVIGIIIASVINMFLGSSFLTLLISLIGVVVFLALTAHDTQNIRRMAAHPEVQPGSDIAIKLGIFGALSLYLNFINLFWFLLQIFGFAGGGDE